MGKSYIFKVLILAVCICLWGSQAIAAESPQAVVQNGADQVRKLLNEYPQATQERREKIREVANQYFDFSGIARLSLGPEWRRLSPEKRQEFTQEFSRLLFGTYIGDIERYAYQNVRYHQRPIDQDHVVVGGALRDQNGQVISIDYYLHRVNGEWRVYDVAAEGVSLVRNYRNQFDSILANSSFDRLSMILKQRVAQMCALNRC